MFQYCLVIALLSCSCVVRANPVLLELSSADRQAILDAVNLYRSDAATRFGASNLQVVEWSEGLTNQTILNHNGIGCTRDASGAFSVNYRSLGENVAIQIKLSSEELSINFTSLIGFWYSQNINYNVSENTCTLGCDLFIQIVSTYTSAVGCSVTTCEIAPFRALFLSCMFAGIHEPIAPYTSLEKRPFKLGDPCSDCPSGFTRCEDNLCTSDEDTAMMGSDPHFSVLLPNGHLLCYTVQGKQNSMFKLISNEHIEMNALFVPDPNPENKVLGKTWLGQIGITVKGIQKHIELIFTAATSDIMVNNKVTIPSNMLDKLLFRTGKLVMMETKRTKRPRVYIEYDDAGLHLSIVFVNDHHLDIVWHSTAQVTGKSGGLVGQFLDKDVEIDEDKKLLIIPGREPMALMKRHVWRFMEKDLKSYDDNNQYCWTTVHPSNQGKGIIKGSFIDYEVKDILSSCS